MNSSQQDAELDPSTMRQWKWKWKKLWNVFVRVNSLVCEQQIHNGYLINDAFLDIVSMCFFLFNETPENQLYRYHHHVILASTSLLVAGSHPGGDEIACLVVPQRWKKWMLWTAIVFFACLPRTKTPKTSVKNAHD